MPRGNCNPCLENGHFKRGVCKWGILKHPIFNVLNFRGWIKRIFDTTDQCNFVINELNPTSEVQNM